MNDKKSGAKAQKKNTGSAKKPLATATKDAVTSSQSKTTPAQEAPVAEIPVAEATPPVTSETTENRSQKMNVNLTRSDKQRSTGMVVFLVEGRPGSVRFSKTLFKNQTAPETIAVDTDAFGFGEARVARTQETKEERKARLKALPKLTPAEKLARLEAKIEKMRTKVNATAAPALETANV